MMSTTDVFVVGGGPAGLAAALAARRQGLNVTVADCAVPPIDKACGEGLMPDSLEALRALGVEIGSVETGWFRGIRFVGGEEMADADFPRGRGRGMRRVLLHRILLRAAQDAGISMHWGARVSAVRDGAVLMDGRAVRCRWIVGADGQNSRVRRWAGLAGAREYERRIGFRRHFRVEPWSEYVEIYWGRHSQAYVTPIAGHEVCVAVMAKKPAGTFAAALEEFPALLRRLGAAPPTTEVRGAVTVTRRLKAVTRGQFALIGEASGSTDAITGEGLAMAFRQAVALGSALAEGELGGYEAQHRRIGRLPQFMGRTMLLMDRSRWIRERALRALCAQPALFQRLLEVHVGEMPLAKFGVRGFFDLGWQILTA